MLVLFDKTTDGLDNATYLELPDPEKHDVKDVQKQIKKMHEQLGHPSKPTFQKMLTSAKVLENYKAPLIFKSECPWKIPSYSGSKCSFLTPKKFLYSKFQLPG